MKYLYFSAGWCGPCRMLGPKMQRLAERIPVQKVDVDQDPGLSSKYGVRSIPTVILIGEGGEVLDRLIGVKAEEEYLKTWREKGGIINSGDPELNK